MRVLILGGEGREHAFAWKLQGENKVEKIFAAPGNAGIAEEAEIAGIDITDSEEIVRFVENKGIDLTITGGQELSDRGSLDSLKHSGCKVLGPGQEAGKLVNDNLRKRRFLLSKDIPAVDCGMFSQSENARKYLEEADYPLQIRPARSASGHQANQHDQPVSATTKTEALEVVERFIQEKPEIPDQNEKSSETDTADVLIEEIPEGERVSVFALADGNIILPFSSARIHRAVFEGGEGALTPGMGGYSPLPSVSFQTDKIIYQDIMLPLLAGLKQRDFSHKGFIAAEVIITEQGPRLVDFQLNLPSTAAVTIIPRLDDSLSKLFQQAAAGSIQNKQITWSHNTAVSIVVTSGGYPLMHEEDFIIRGLDSISGEDTRVFHISTRKEEDNILTDGGRVLAVTALAEGHFAAVDRVNRCLDELDFQDMHYRTDIGSGAVLDVSLEEIREEEMEEDEERLFEGDWD